jgi:NADH-quinone oxidoreductase subunit N
VLTAENILAILPEILLLVLAGFVIAFDAIWPESKRRNLGWLTAGGLLGVIALSVLFALPTDSRLAFGDMVRNNLLTFTFKMLFIFGSAATALFAMDFEGLGKRGEFYALMVISTIGMNLMASANDLIMLYIAIETTSIPMYVLAGFLRADHKSTEAGFKYLLFGALTSTIMLYGFSLLFGLTGSTSFDGISAVLNSRSAPLVPAIGALLLVLVGFGFKISAVPFHFWAPDVYEGAPTPVAGLLSTASKAAGFAVLVRFLLAMFSPNPELISTWTALLAALSVVTMTLGNLVSLAQKNIKRLLAYSSIAHAGYILIGVVALNDLALPSVLFYLGAYLLTNLAAFGAVTVVSKAVGSDEIKAYAGLSRRSPLLGIILLVAFLSLSGMPPLAGFVAKVFVFAAAVKSDWIWLAFVGVINSIVGLYYYLNVLKVVYLYRAENLEDESKPLLLTRPHQIALVALTFAVLLVGAFFGPWFDIAAAAAKVF